MTDKWEVVRIHGDERAHVRSTHKSVELAERAFAKAVKSNEFYAVDVCFLPNGREVDFDPIFGIANGFQWVQHSHASRTVWSEDNFND